MSAGGKKLCEYHGRNNSHGTAECKAIKAGKTKGPPAAAVGGGGRSNSNSNSNRKKKKRNNQRNRSRRPKNTTDFQPNYDPPDLRIRMLSATALATSLDTLTVHDVCYVPELVCKRGALSLYHSVIKEITSASSKGDELFVKWHGDSHVIANDRAGGNWKPKVPTLTGIIERLERYFNFKTNATRVNWYRPNTDDWKPYHHDRAAFTPNEPQNFTIAISLGREREIGFEHAKSGVKLFLPVANGSAYTFSRDVNIEWKHGVVPTREKSDIGRVSIIAWGLRDQSTAQSRITTNAAPSAQDLGLK